MIRIILKLDDQMSKGLDSAANKLQKIGGSMKSLGQTMTVGITAPIVAMGTAMFKTFADFESVMVELEARTGSTAEEMEKMKQFAIEMGRDTAFSTTEAAEALLELTSSGSSAAEAMEMLPDVLDLAAAGALELGQAADGVTDILAQFGMESYQAISVVDSLTKAAGASSATVEDLVQAFGNVGPVANQFGLGVNETAAAIATLSEAGIKGAEAGTNLKSMLLNMSRTTDTAKGAWRELGISMFDAAGEMRPIDDVFKDINKAMEDMSTEDQIRLSQNLAGSYGIVGFNALRAANGISDMELAMQGAASAHDVAAARMNTLKGAFDSLMGSLETLGIVMGGLGEGPLTSFIKWLTDAINAVTAFAQAHPKLAQGIMLVVAAIAALGPIIFIIGSVVSAVGTIGAALAAVGGIVGIVTTVTTGLGVAFTAITGPIGLAIIAIAALAVAFDKISGGKVSAIPEVWGKNFKMLGEIISLATEKAVQWGSAFIGGFIEGMKKKILDAVAVVINFAMKVHNAIKSALKISSPSKVMMKLGEQVVAGFNQGIDSMGGIGVQVPALAGAGASVSSPSTGGGFGGGNVYIENLTVPPGTTQEQIRYLMQEFAKAAKKRGARGGI